MKRAMVVLLSVGMVSLAQGCGLFGHGDISKHVAGVCDCEFEINGCPNYVYGGPGGGCGGPGPIQPIAAQPMPVGPVAVPPGATPVLSIPPVSDTKTADKSAGIAK